MLDLFAKTVASIPQLQDKPKVVVALSGGIDSLALAILANQHFKETITVTIDHALRAESTAEAQQAASIMQSHGIAHHTITRTEDLNDNNTQAAARQYRYSALTAFCHKHGIDNLLTGHHQDDNIETFLLRLLRGSGVDGLSSMPVTTVYNGINIIRPLLNTTKAKLQNFLTQQNITWIEDPTNSTDKYDRNKLRHLLEQMQDAELLNTRITGTIAHMQRASGYLQQQTDQAFVEITTAQGEQLHIQHDSFLQLHDEIALRLLVRIITSMTGQEYKPRFEKLQRLHSTLQGKQAKHQLCGLEWVTNGNDIIVEKQ